MEFYQETKAVAVEAAFASNLAYDKLTFMEQQLEHYRAHSDNDTGNIKELRRKTKVARINYHTLIDMAGRVTEYCDPYETKSFKELPDDHDFISWVDTEDDGEVPVICEENYKAIYRHLHPNLNNPSVALACKVMSDPSFATLTIEDAATGNTKRIFKDEFFAYVPIDENCSGYRIRADKVYDLAKCAEENLEHIKGLKANGFKTLKEIAVFIQHHADTLFGEKK